MKSRIIAIVGSQKKQSTPFVILLQVESVSSSSAMQRAVLLVCLEAASHQLSCKTGSGSLKESRVNTLKCDGIQGIIKSVLMFPGTVIIETIRSHIAEQQGALNSLIA